jgi:hypothetical protein
MKIELKKKQTINGKAYKAGGVVIVRKDEGERLIAGGVANRVIEQAENRMVDAPGNRGVHRFSAHKVW